MLGRKFTIFIVSQLGIGIVVLIAYHLKLRNITATVKYTLKCLQYNTVLCEQNELVLIYTFLVMFAVVHIEGMMFAVVHIEGISVMNDPTKQWHAIPLAVFNRATYSIANKH